MTAIGVNPHAISDYLKEVMRLGATDLLLSPGSPPVALTTLGPDTRFRRGIGGK